MNQKPARVSRTWHSLWDEMFSAFSVSESGASGEGDADAWSWTSDFAEPGREGDELEVLKRMRDADNDNGK